MKNKKHYTNDWRSTQNSTIDTLIDDPINHPKHYTNGGMECIEEMLLVFGKETVAHFCLCNVWKYRYRASGKGGDQDLQKSHWYMQKYKELMGNKDIATITFTGSPLTITNCSDLHTNN